MKKKKKKAKGGEPYNMRARADRGGDGGGGAKQYMVRQRPLVRC